MPREKFSNFFFKKNDKSFCFAATKKYFVACLDPALFLEQGLKLVKGQLSFV